MINTRIAKNNTTASIDESMIAVPIKITKMIAESTIIFAMVLLINKGFIVHFSS